MATAGHCCPIPNQTLFHCLSLCLRCIPALPPTPTFDAQPGTLLDLMGRHKYMLESHTIIHIFASVCHAVAAMHHQKPPLAHRWVGGEHKGLVGDCRAVAG
jgi:hypothetical protein